MTDLDDRFDQYEVEEFFGYLDDLRESGECNMFAAPGYLIGEFDLSRRDARDVFLAWMEGFDERHANDK